MFTAGIALLVLLYVVPMSPEQELVCALVLLVPALMERR